MKKNSLVITEAIKFGEEELKIAGIENSYWEARWLLAFVLKTNLPDLIINNQKKLSDVQLQEFHNLIFKRKQRIPFAQIVSSQEFFGLEFKITPDVLVPRPETEILVEEGVRIIGRGTGKGGGRKTPIVIDVGTGSGCIAIALAKNIPEIKIFAIDLSSKALEIAKENAKIHSISEKITFLQGDLFTPLNEIYNTRHCEVDAGCRGNSKRNNEYNKAHIIISNPPYIAASQILELEPEVKDFEPIIAIDGGSDGLDFIRRLIEQSVIYLKPDGVLIFEIGYDQAEKVENLLQKSGHYKNFEFVLDYNGIKRIVIAK
jgi:release factor glutamine methyltransferase